MKRIICTSILILFLTFLSTNVKSKSFETLDEIDLPSKHYFGMTAGFTTGIGLSYRYVPNKFGLQLAFSSFSISKTNYYSTGLSFMYNLSTSETTRSFIYQANHLFSQNQKDSEFSYLLNNGLGFGVELFTDKRTVLNIMAGYAHYSRQNVIRLTGEIAFLYRI